MYSDTINKEKIDEMITKVIEVENEVSKIIIGQKDIIRNCLVAILCGGNVLLEGVPGLGKTQLIKTIANALELSFSRIQFTPDLMPADIIGTNILVRDASGNSSFKFQNGPVFSNIVLADEINRATPKTQSALLEAMQEHTVTVNGNTIILPTPYMVLATQNPVEMEGTYPLPEAQLDRFMFKLSVDYPSINELIEIADLTTSDEIITINKRMDRSDIEALSSIIKRIPASKPVMLYAANILMGTHPNSSDLAKKYIRFGASPRAMQGIVMAARAFAILDGRLNVAYQDIKNAAFPVLRHRFSLTFDAISENLTSDILIQKIIDSIKLNKLKGRYEDE